MVVALSVIAPFKVVCKKFVSGAKNDVGILVPPYTLHAVGKLPLPSGLTSPRTPNN